jgi:hypothetical protein
VHEALAAYYVPRKRMGDVRRGKHPVKTFRALYDQQLEQYGEFGMFTEEEEWENARELGVAMLRGYLLEYGDQDQYIQVIAPEHPFSVDVYDPETENYLCTYVGTFDAVIRDLHTGKLGLFEHKTAAQIRTDHLWNDEQAGAYFAYAKEFFQHEGLLRVDEDLDFILYNFLRKGMPDDRPRNAEGLYLNKDGSVSKKQPSPLFRREIVRRGVRTRRTVMLRAIQEFKEMEMVRQGVLPVRKNFTRDCSWCEFQKNGGMCELHEIGSDWESVRDGLFTTWEPYEIHEDSKG